jgi:superfamily I DNA/RNA helicase
VGTELMATLPKIAEPGNPLPAYGLRRKHLLLDEAQDNNAAQWALARALVHAGARCTVVGDAAQSIYRFRGARAEGLVELLQAAAQKRLDVRTHTLTVSMRSEPAIVALGNHVVRELNHFAAVKPDSLPRPGVVDARPDPLRFQACLDESEQADLITEAARRALAEGKSVMVLFRANGQKGPLAQALRLLAKPFADNRLQHLSVHRAKGLEADVVILQGLTATRWPDLRGDPAEEANIFHVAVTRAREQVHFVCPCTVRAINGAGELVDEWVGPSPYLHQVAHLRAAFIEKVEWSAGLSELGCDQAAELLATGLAIHAQSREDLAQERYGRLQMLRLEAGLVTPQTVAQKPPHYHQDFLQRLQPEPTPQVRRFLALIQKSQNGQSPAAEAPVGRVAQEVVP